MGEYSRFFHDEGQKEKRSLAAQNEFLEVPLILDSSCRPCDNDGMFENDSVIVTCSCDALARRIEKDVAGGLTTHDYYGSDWQVLSEFDAGTTDCRSFVYGNYLDEALMMMADDGTNQNDYYYAHDYLYSVAALLDDTGTVIERYEYDAYGKPMIMTDAGSGTWWDGDETIASASAIGNPVAFTGQRFDPETGLYYYKNRTYNPTQGRFIQTDPVDYLDCLNLYQYATNNPLLKVDLYGTWSILAEADGYFGLGGCRAK